MPKLKVQSHNLKLKSKNNYSDVLIITCLLFIFHFSFFTSVAQATDYVLPYPSYLPGHKLYKIHQILEKVQEYWYFGNIAKFKYHLKMSNKYLVEAKTLFEYKQYLLALNALRKSNKHFQKCEIYLEKGKREKKDISQKQQILFAAAKKHRDVLDNLLNEIPSSVIWEEENRMPIKLEIHKKLNESRRGTVKCCL